MKTVGRIWKDSNLKDFILLFSTIQNCFIAKVAQDILKVIIITFTIFWDLSWDFMRFISIRVPKVPFRFFDKFRYEIRNKVWIFVFILKLRQKTSK